ncbi:MAG TPA: hypothetical protein DEP62_07625, partial [Flavobacteriales bacterium]|nr:hypothetical protein [Flavobacteriales bacterium]
MMGLARQAILYTLVLHVVVLGAMVAVPVSEGVPPSETYAAVDFLDAEDVVEPAQSFEASFQAKLAQQVANLRANAQSELSSERQSSASDVSQAELEAQVEAELRA